MKTVCPGVGSYYRDPSPPPFLLRSISPLGPWVGAGTGLLALTLKQAAFAVFFGVGLNACARRLMENAKALSRPPSRECSSCMDRCCYHGP